MEERILKCPNCGANATNHDNCEYCGSLLVRFVSKGIDLSNTSYTSNTNVFPGLIQELKQNLTFQKQGSETTATDIHRSIENSYPGSTGGICSVLRPGCCCWQDNQYITLYKSNIGLIIVLDFSTYVDADTSEIMNFNKESERKHELFKQLPCFNLFTSHRSFYTDDNGDKRKGCEYAIDFGEDAEGAARLISEIMTTVYGIPLDENIEYYTNYGQHNIDETRKNIEISRGLRSNTPWGRIIIIAILTILASLIII